MILPLSYAQIVGPTKISGYLAHTGIVSFDTSNWKDGKLVITLEDPDLNKDPNSIEKLTLPYSSDITIQDVLPNDPEYKPSEYTQKYLQGSNPVVFQSDNPSRFLDSNTQVIFGNNPITKLVSQNYLLFKTNQDFAIKSGDSILIKNGIQKCHGAICRYI